MWYEGSREPTGTYLWRIGYATAPVTIIVPRDVPTIQAGIDSANDGNIVLVEEGTYYENINFKGKAITVASRYLMDGDTSHISNTIIDGSQPSNPDSGSVVYFVSGEDTTSVLKGFTITGGSGTIIIPGIIRGSGGIHCGNAGAKICHNRIINNSVTSTFQQVFGGGINAGPPTSSAFIVVEDNLIQYNTTTGNEYATGAGMFLGINARISGNRILDNIASAENQQAWGGGMASSSADSVIVTQNIVLRNKAQTNSNTELANGGGMFFFRDSTAFVRIIGNRIAYNEIKSNAFQGGAGVGIERTGNLGGDVLFANNLVYKNKHTGSETCRGGGLYLHRSKVKVINNTITENKASYGGGFCSSISESSLLMNNIIWGDTATISGGEIDIFYGSSPTFVYNDIQGGWPGEGNISKEPMLRGDDYHLSDSSSCIGAGIDSIQIGGVWYHCPPTCFLGHARPTPSDSMPDMGACESPLGSPIVGLEQYLSNNLPTSYKLSQNYPNPFNPNTTIEFDLPKTSEVTLKVFNILGEKVATLVSDRLSAGSYSYEWDASNLASGVYLYRLQADEPSQGAGQGYVETRKMMLMR
jgi:hypothetical protein